MAKDITALVPMKAHSERVPEKNTRAFNGRPLFHWILGTLTTAESIDRVAVNTDSEQIAREGPELFDIQIITRPETLQGDYVSMNDILLHDVSTVDSTVFLQTHCTNPLLRPETVDNAVEAFLDADNHDSLFSVTPRRTRLWDENCDPINHERDRLLPTQELSPIYEENSNLYLFTQSSIECRENRIGNDPMMFEIDAQESIDIDDMTDFKFAELLHREKYGNKPDLISASAYEGGD